MVGEHDFLLQGAMNQGSSSNVLIRKVHFDLTCNLVDWKFIIHNLYFSHLSIFIIFLNDAFNWRLRRVSSMDWNFVTYYFLPFDCEYLSFLRFELFSKVYVKEFSNSFGFKLAWLKYCGEVVVVVKVENIVLSGMVRLRGN